MVAAVMHVPVGHSDEDEEALKKAGFRYRDGQWGGVVSEKKARAAERRVFGTLEITGPAKPARA